MGREGDGPYTEGHDESLVAEQAGKDVGKPKQGDALRFGLLGSELGDCLGMDGLRTALSTAIRQMTNPKQGMARPATYHARRWLRALGSVGYACISPSDGRTFLPGWSRLVPS